jgi:hypothetical protein
VVYKLMVSVVTCPTGQFVTVGAQEVMVYVVVAYTVETDQAVGYGVSYGVAFAVAVASASVTGQTVVYRLMTSVVV